MSEMVERVARVLCARNGEPESCLKFYRDDARAAIEAMREPTAAMVDASDIGDEEFNVTNSAVCTIEFWRTMIDEALK